MKATELIAALEHLIDQHGDLDVATIDPEYGDTDDVREVAYMKGEFVLL